MWLRSLRVREDNIWVLKSGLWLVWLSWFKCGFVFLPLVCALVCSLFAPFVFWFYIICDISISLCVCVFDMPIILQQVCAVTTFIDIQTWEFGAFCAPGAFQQICQLRARIWLALPARTSSKQLVFYIFYIFFIFFIYFSYLLI